MVKNDINARYCAGITSFISLLGRCVGSFKLNLSLNSGLVLNEVKLILDLLTRAENFITGKIEQSEFSMQNPMSIRRKFEILRAI